MKTQKQGPLEMRKCYLKLSAAALVGLLLPGLVAAQSATKSQANQGRYVKGRVLTSVELPPLRVRFSKAFKYIGSQRFILYGRAQVEQHFFVDADKQRRIKRMYMLQFEGYLPGISDAYNYPVTKTVNLAGQNYIANAEVVPDVPAALKQDSQSDIAHAASLLENKGYSVGKAIMFERFVRLVDEAKRNEFILLYVETLGDHPLPQMEQVEQDLSRRALKGFTILR
jgi:hypothetical protein